MQAERWQIEEVKPADPTGHWVRIVYMGEYDSEAMEAPEVGEVLVRKTAESDLAAALISDSFLACELANADSPNQVTATLRAAVDRTKEAKEGGEVLVREGCEDDAISEDTTGPTAQGSVEALIQYKDALEDRCARLEATLGRVGHILPRSESWDGAPGRLEDIAGALDRGLIERPNTSEYEAH
jgi:hypothetical protein